MRCHNDFIGETDSINVTDRTLLHSYTYSFEFFSSRHLKQFQIAVKMFCYSEKVEGFFFVFIYFSFATSIGLISTSRCIFIGLNAYILKQSMIYSR